MRITKAILFASAFALTAPAMAQKVQTGSLGDMSWTAQSYIVGMAPTAGGAGPRFPEFGDSRYAATAAKYSGVVPIIMDYGPGGAFICTASLVGARTLVTAAHCVSDGFGTAGPLTTTAYFLENSSGTDRVPFNPSATALTISNIWVNPGYTGQVVDHNDIAILQLGGRAPDWAAIYDMGLDITSLRGVDFNVAGYGNRSLNGGGGASGGATAGTTGFLRQGDNKFDYRMGDPIFSQIPGNGWQTIYPNNPNIAYSYLSDFDNGLAANDMACRVAQASNLAQAAGAVFCDLGRGATEVGVAGGDSGGPQFDALGRIVSVTSYGLTFGTAWGDCRSGLQSSCGEFSGYAPLYHSADFIRGAFATSNVPEPATWAMMIAGFGLVGSAMRRRRNTAVTA